MFDSPQSQSRLVCQQRADHGPQLQRPADQATQCLELLRLQRGSDLELGICGGRALPRAWRSSSIQTLSLTSSHEQPALAFVGGDYAGHDVGLAVAQELSQARLAGVG